MSHENLRSLLAQLHAQLSHGTTLDSEARKLLADASQEIEKALARTSDDTAPAKSSLESLAVKLEVEHPAVAHVARQLVDALGKAGI